MSAAAHTLIVVRHAKSAWPAGVPDDQRPLNARGTRDAPEVGRWLAERDLVPDLAFVSPALRTQQTWQLLSAELGTDVPAVTADQVYAASWNEMLDVVRTADEPNGVVAIVGHNPGSAELVVQLAGPDSDRDLVAAVTAKYPTAGTSVLRFEGLWADLRPHTARLVDFAAPRG